MSKFKHFWIILTAFTPLTASGVNAQQFGAPIDLIAPVQEDIIRDLRQNPQPTNSRSSSGIRYSKVSPKFIKALQDCNNDYISRSIAARRVVENVLFIHPQLLQRAYQCGAISSNRHEQLLNYQGAYYQKKPVKAAYPNLSASKPSSTNNSVISPKFIQALRNCNNSFIRGYVDARRAYSLPIPLQLLQRAKQCGAI
jgi:hypothetical protein